MMKTNLLEMLILGVLENIPTKSQYPWSDQKRTPGEIDLTDATSIVGKGRAAKGRTTS